MLARQALDIELIAASAKRRSFEQNEERSQQIGSGMRGDKIRTYREQDGSVTDHRSNRKASLKAIEAGKLELLR